MNETQYVKTLERLAEWQRKAYIGINRVAAALPESKRPEAIRLMEQARHWGEALEKMIKEEAAPEPAKPRRVTPRKRQPAAPVSRFRETEIRPNPKESEALRRQNDLYPAHYRGRVPHWIRILAAATYDPVTPGSVLECVVDASGNVEAIVDLIDRVGVLPMPRLSFEVASFHKT